MNSCTSHHFACNCREREFKGYLVKLERAEAKLKLAEEALEKIVKGEDWDACWHVERIASGALEELRK